MKLILIAAPVLVAAAWMYFYWFTTAVFPVSENYPKGQLKSAGYVRRAGVEAYKRHGHWVTFHENGQKESEGFYDLGVKTSDWKYWDAEGHPLSSGTRAHSTSAGSGDG